VERVKAMVAVSKGDGTLHLTHGDQEGMAPLGGPSSGDPASGMAGGLLTGDEPPPFSGRPTAGGKMDPIVPASTSDRRAARDSMKRVKVADGAGHLHAVRDGFAPRRNSKPAMDAASAASRASFLKRFPAAARLRQV
jgi:hypothetical protein